MFELLTTLVFGGIAIFFAIRLYSVLGRHEGHMEPPSAAKPAGDAARPENGAAPALRPAFDGPAAAGLESIAQADPGFDPRHFVDGAKSAYRMISDAFAKGDTETLRGLLSDTVYSLYEKTIKDRESRGETCKIEIERIADADITSASHDDGRAEVTVAFTAEIATETVDKDGQRVSGDLGQLSTVAENWTFQRETRSSDPNWVLAGVAAS